MNAHNVVVVVVFGIVLYYGWKAFQYVVAFMSMGVVG